MTAEGRSQRFTRGQKRWFRLREIVWVLGLMNVGPTNALSPSGSERTNDGHSTPRELSLMPRHRLLTPPLEPGSGGNRLSYWKDGGRDKD
ncbi:hypothetical protein MPL1032_240160 [Mesorhizobium plurifarium]|uniref:Uncharacterized protein n=1 Tax=Mesorhizobium plurifarium TaxID=69974 RepID=A0A0K2W0I5_MESPL|nr:hypothetical protein MPL1032_240160 [Mesorhizobium plurifarium]